MGEQGGNFKGYGFGPPRESMAGFPHFQDVTFRGEFPFADITYKDKKFPGSVTLTAFNPFIPLNDKDSSIPAAFFEITLKNTTKKDIIPKRCDNVRLKNLKMPYRTAFFAF